MSLAESTAKIYDAEATSWSRTEPVLLSDYTARPFLLDWCGDVEGKQVLDLGCGEGYISRQLIERGAATCYGIDISAEMVRQAQEQSPGPQARFEAGDARCIEGLEDASRDLAVAVFLFNYLDRDGCCEVMKQVRRVLRRPGRFIFSVPHPALPYLRPKHAAPFYFEPDGGYFDASDRTFEGQIWRRDGESVHVRCVHKTIADYFELFARAGFRRMPEVRELGVTDEHCELDPAFFEPLRGQPLHLAFRFDLEDEA